MKLKDWVVDERPREKMLEKGASALSNAELLAILLRTGLQGTNVLDVARNFLNQAGGSLTKASQMSIEQMCRIDGIGPSKALGLVAALELGKRMCAEAPDFRERVIKSAEDVYREMIPHFRGLQHEECWMLFISRSNKIISKECLSSGGESSTVVEVKSIVRRALDTHATAVILTHNHPSGNPRPGNADISLTSDLRRALKMFEIRFLDHIVISDGLYYSFTDDAVSTMK